MSEGRDGNRALVERYFAAINADDFETLGGVWAADAVFEAVGARPRHGVEEIVGVYRRLFEPWAVHRDEPTRILQDGDTLTVEVSFSGTTHDGKQLTFPAVDVIDVADGRIQRLSNWYDIALVRRAMAACGH